MMPNPQLPTLFGVYRSEEYSFLPEVYAFEDRSPDLVQEAFNLLPNRMQMAITEIRREYKLSSERFAFYSYDYSSFKPSEGNSLRLNVVLHPIVLFDSIYEIYSAPETITYPKLSLYHGESAETTYSNVHQIDEFEQAKFNIVNFSTPYSQLKVHFHYDEEGYPCFSPNNAAFSLETTQPMSVCGLICLYQKNNNYELFFTWCTFLDLQRLAAQSISSADHLYPPFYQEMEHFQLKIESLFSEVMNQLVFRSVVNSEGSTSEAFSFFDWVSLMLKSTKFNGDSIFALFKDPKNIEYCFNAWVLEVLRTLNRTCNLLLLTDKKLSALKHQKLLMIEEERRGRKDIQLSELLYFKNLQQKIGDFDVFHWIADTILKNNFTKFLFGSLCEKVWRELGAPMDIHNDFGRAALLHEDSLDKKYHLSSGHMICIVNDILRLFGV